MSLREKIGYSEEHSLEYKQALWKLLISMGGVVQVEQTEEYGTPARTASALISANWSYYGSVPSAMPLELTEEALKTIESGINWDETQVPETGSKSAFNGTFTDSQLYIPYLCGLLIPNEGDISLWWVRGAEFSSTVRLITNSDATMEDAVEDCWARINKLKQTGYSTSSWPYSLEVRL